MNDAIVKPLGSKTDKTGQLIELKFCNQTSIGPAKLMSFFYKNFSELIDNGHGPSQPNYHSKSMAIYAEINNEIVGLIMFNYDSEFRFTYIVFTVVDKNCRNRGICKLMYHELETTSKKLGASHIRSYVHLNNLVQIANSKSANFNPKYYVMIKNI